MLNCCSVGGSWEGTCKSKSEQKSNLRDKRATRSCADVSVRNLPSPVFLFPLVGPTIPHPAAMPIMFALRLDPSRCACVGRSARRPAWLFRRAEGDAHGRELAA